MVPYCIFERPRTYLSKYLQRHHGIWLVILAVSNSKITYSVSDVESIDETDSIRPKLAQEFLVPLLKSFYVWLRYLRKLKERKERKINALPICSKEKKFGIRDSQVSDGTLAIGPARLLSLFVRVVSSRQFRNSDTQSEVYRAAYTAYMPRKRMKVGKTILSSYFVLSSNHGALHDILLKGFGLVFGNVVALDTPDWKCQYL